MAKLLSLREAARYRTIKLRQPQWADKRDYIEIHISKDGNIGPWVKFFGVQDIPDAAPTIMLVTEFDLDSKDWERFTL